METNGIHTEEESTEVIAQVQPAAPVMISGKDWALAENQKLLKNTVARGTTNEEFAMFRELCIGTGLNPFKREIWCIIVKPDDPKWRQCQIMTGINGYFMVANRHSSFDGLEWEAQHDEKGKLISVTAKVWRKDRKFPSTGVALWSEFGKQHGNWKTMPQHMLLKCAKAIALREAFPQELDGVYVEEEMPVEFGKDYNVRDALGADFNPYKIERTFRKFILQQGKDVGKRLEQLSYSADELQAHLYEFIDEYDNDSREAIALRIEELKKKEAVIAAKKESINFEEVADV